jgi:hypothetical protein
MIIRREKQTAHATSSTMNLKYTHQGLNLRRKPGIYLPDLEINCTVNSIPTCHKYVKLQAYMLLAAEQN